MANEIKKELIQKKLDLVIQKLMHLGAPENEDTLKEGGEAIGFFSRDFGIKEWDWPQGIGLYGLLKIAKMQDSEEYRTFLHDWFKENIAQGLPSRNINTTTPLLTLCELNEIYHDPEFEALCLDWAKWLMECIPRTREGGFQHVTSANGDRQGVRLNESEMWIDTLFMTVLFLNRMGQKYGKQEWIDESIKHVRNSAVVKHLEQNIQNVRYPHRSVLPRLVVQSDGQLWRRVLVPRQQLVHAGYSGLSGYV